jgi:hypothetical protein
MTVSSHIIITLYVENFFILKQENRRQNKIHIGINFSPYEKYRRNDDYTKYNYNFRHHIE